MATSQRPNTSTVLATHKSRCVIAVERWIRKVTCYSSVSFGSSFGNSYTSALYREALEERERTPPSRLDLADICMDRGGTH